MGDQDGAFSVIDFDPEITGLAGGDLVALTAPVGDLAVGTVGIVQFLGTLDDSPRVAVFFKNARSGEARLMAAEGFIDLVRPEQLTRTGSIY